MFDINENDLIEQSRQARISAEGWAVFWLVVTALVAPTVILLFTMIVLR